MDFYYKKNPIKNPTVAWINNTLLHGFFYRVTNDYCNTEKSFTITGRWSEQHFLSLLFHIETNSLQKLIRKKLSIGNASFTTTHKKEF